MSISNPPDDPVPPILEIQNLAVHFPVVRGLLFPREIGRVRAVDDVSLTLPKSATLGLVGESGSGKSTLGRAILRLNRPISGEIYFDGENLLALSEKHMRPYRARIQMIFQDPYSSLNPRMTVREIIEEPLIVHRNLDEASRLEQVMAQMDLVGLSTRYLGRYPHEFSGGQRQRIAIARSLMLDPELIIADEPVSALDVSIQAQILNLLADIRARLGLAMLFISHDLAVVRHLCENVAVMSQGRIVETGSREKIFEAPVEAYTRTLLEAVLEP